MKYFGLLLFIVNCYAEDVVVSTLGQGACWFQYKDSLKLVSFNDRQSLNISNEELNRNLLSLISKDNKEIESLQIHCSSIGASLVARVRTDQGVLCLWASPQNGQLKTRSLGGTLKNEPKLCDGYKPGELLVVIKNHDYYDQLTQNEKWTSVIKEIIPVAFNFYKIKLNEDYFFREDEVVRMLKDNLGSTVSVEFNQYQHGVGEYAQLK
jgi:hypothetical protein